MSRGGPASRNAIDPAVLVGFVDTHSRYVFSGFPKRTRLTINGIAITTMDARMIRRWRAGQITGVTVKSTESLLDRHGLTLGDFSSYCIETEQPPCIRGTLKF